MPGDIFGHFTTAGGALLPLIGKDQERYQTSTLHITAPLTEFSGLKCP